jgi:hypothetical protein
MGDGLKRAIAAARATRKNPAAVALGQRGGKAYAKNTTAEDRKKQAENAAQARWSKQKKEKK